MKTSILSISIFALLSFGCNTSENVHAQDSSMSEQSNEATFKNNNESIDSVSANKENGKVIQITTVEFKELIYDYTQHPDTWVYKGTKPCVIDFYADWCRPCKIIEPILAELAVHYKDDVIFYKVNTDQERELSQVFQIKSIPLVVFSPVNGNPEGALGALSKEDYMQKIDSLLLKK